MKIPDYLEGLNRWQKWLLSLLLSLAVALADFITGDFSLIIFYVVPIAFASWFIGRSGGFLIAMMCGIELISIEYLVSPKLSVVSIRSWNALMEVCYLILTGYLLSKMKVEMEQRRQRSHELEAANKELDAFNYTVAHDLRTPLTVVNGYLQLVEERSQDRLDRDCNGYLHEAYEGISRMNQLIDDLLNFSSMARVQLVRQTVDLSALAQEVVAVLEQTEQGRRVEFRIREGISAYADKNLLRIVISNLVGNAWKYTRVSNPALIEFGVADSGGKPVYFIRDNGTGFDMRDACKLFLPFQRLKGSEKFKGFGIGLATVERIIQRHDGRIWAEGEPGKGATFYFTLNR